MKFDYPSHATVPVSKAIEPEEEEKSSMASSRSNFSTASLTHFSTSPQKHQGKLEMQMHSIIILIGPALDSFSRLSLTVAFLQEASASPKLWLNGSERQSCLLLMSVGKVYLLRIQEMRIQ